MSPLAFSYDSVRQLDFITAQRTNQCFFNANCIERNYSSVNGAFAKDFNSSEFHSAKSAFSASSNFAVRKYHVGSPRLCHISIPFSRPIYFLSLRAQLDFPFSTMIKHTVRVRVDWHNYNTYPYRLYIVSDGTLHRNLFHSSPLSLREFSARNLSHVSFYLAIVTYVILVSLLFKLYVYT